MFWLWVGLAVAVVLLLAWRSDRKRAAMNRAADQPGAGQGQLMTETQRMRDVGGSGGLGGL